MAYNLELGHHPSQAFLPTVNFIKLVSLLQKIPSDDASARILSPKVSEFVQEPTTEHAGWCFHLFA